MTTTLNASTAGAGGFIATGDNSGSLALQTAGTTAVTIDTSQNVTLTGGGQLRSNTTNTPVTFADSAGTQVGTLCRAWVSATTPTTVTASFNVSSVSIPQTGIMQINFTNAMPDTKYAVVQSSSQAEDGTQEASLSVITNVNFNTTGFRVYCQTRLTAITPSVWFVAVFR